MNKRSWILGTVVFFSGAAVMAFEILASRLIAPYFGSDVYTWGNLIGVILLSLTLGYIIGGKVADRNPHGMLSGLFLILSGVWVAIVPLLCHPVSLWVSGLNLSGEYKPLLVCFLLFMPGATLMATVTPIALKAVAHSLENLGNVAGKLNSLSTLGSLAGTFLTTLVLVNISSLGTKRSLLLIGFGLIVCGGLLFIFFGRKRKTIALILASAFASQLALGGFQWDRPVPPVADGSKLIDELETPYHQIRIYERQGDDGSGDFLRTMAFGGGGMDEQSSVWLLPGLPDDSYYRPVYRLAWAFRSDIKDIAIIGTAGGTGPRDLLRAMPASLYPDLHIDAVDIDGEVFGMGRQYFDYPEDSSRLRSLTIDGRVFFRTLNRNLDLVILDAFNYGGRVPEHLVTREFFEEMKAKMAVGGVVAMNVLTATENAPPGLELKNNNGLRVKIIPNAAVFLTLLKTLRDVFGKDSVAIYPLLKGSCKIPACRYLIGNVMIFAVNSNTRGRFFPDKSGFLRAFGGMPDAAADWESYVKMRWDEPSNAEYIADYEKAELLTDDFNPINLYFAEIQRFHASIGIL